MSKTFLYSLFHCNLDSSLIPRRDFSSVVERCYQPLLDLAEGGYPIGIGMTGGTLKEVSRLAPGFLIRLRKLWEEGKVEFIGSGYSQAVFPLIPAEVNRWSLKCANASYRQFLGRVPITALVNEQTYSRGLVDLYHEAGYENIIMDWDNPYRHNRYPKEYLYSPQKAAGISKEIKLLWSNSIGVKKFSKYVHGEITEDEYLDYLSDNHRERTNRVIALYTNNAEVFDYRSWEGPLKKGEYVRVKDILSKIAKDKRFKIVTPTEAIKRFKNKPGAFNLLTLESTSTPLVTGVEDTHNPVRWAVSGRDDTHINTVCHRIYENLKTIIDKGVASSDTIMEFREELCSLWGSDFRTDTIDEKYIYFWNRLGWLKCETERLLRGAAVKGVATLAVVGGGTVESVVAEDGLPECCRDTNPFKNCDCGDNKCARASVSIDENTIEVNTGKVTVEFLKNKGFAIKFLAFPEISEKSLVGTLPYGYYDEIGYREDFFTGHLIHISRDGMRTTDLVKPADYIIEENTDAVLVTLRCDLSIGTLWKTFEVSKNEPRLEVRLRMKVRDLAASSLRSGIFTLNPRAFDRDSLWFETVNGGPAPERFFLKGHTVRHDEPVSPTVSATGCLGATEGWVTIGDREKTLEIRTDKTCLYSVPMVKYVELEEPAGKDYFFRLLHSVGEIDDTARWVWRGDNEIVFSVTAWKNK